MNGPSPDWPDVIRPQLSFRKDRVVVIAECPKCAFIIGTWLEGGMVSPHGLFYGDYKCPCCGWEPLLGPVGE